MSVNEVRQAYMQELVQVSRGDPFADPGPPQRVKQRLVDEFVNSDALVLGRRARLHVSDADVLQSDAQIPAFQVDGKFDYGPSVALLRAQGRSIPEIEKPCSNAT